MAQDQFPPPPVVTVVTATGAVAGASTRAPAFALIGKDGTSWYPLSANADGALEVFAHSAFPVTGPLTDEQLRATAVPVAGPLTDAELRDTAVPVTVSGNVATDPPEPSDGTLLSSSSRSSSTNSSDQTNNRHRGVLIYWDVTATAGGGQTVQVLLQGKDPVSGQYVTLLQTATQSSSGVQGLMLHPGHTTTIAGFGNLTTAASACLPRIWRIRIVHSGGGSWTYSAGYCLLP